MNDIHRFSDAAEGDGVGGEPSPDMVPPAPSFGAQAADQPSTEPLPVAEPLTQQPEPTQPLPSQQALQHPGYRPPPTATYGADTKKSSGLSRGVVLAIVAVVLVALAGVLVAVFFGARALLGKSDEAARSPIVGGVSSPESPEATVSLMYELIVKGEGAKACALFSEEMQALFTTFGSDCPSVMEGGAELVQDDIANLDLDAITTKVTEESSAAARVEVSAPGQPGVEVDLVKKSGAWLIDDMGGIRRIAGGIGDSLP